MVWMPRVWAALALVCGAQGFRRIDNFTDGVSMHFWDRRCNPLKYREWSYLTAGDNPEGYQDREVLKTLVIGQQDSPRRGGELAARPNGLAWFSSGEDRGDGLLDLWMSELKDFHQMFLHSAELNALNGKPWYSFDSYRAWTLYRTKWQATHSVFLRSVRGAADLRADGHRVVFTMQGRADGFARELRAYDIKKKTQIAVEFPAPCDADAEVMILSPALAGRYLLAQRYDAAAASELFLFDLEFGVRESLGHSRQSLVMTGHAWLAHRALLHDDGTDVPSEDTVQSVACRAELPVSRAGTANALKLAASQSDGNARYATWAAESAMTVDAVIFLTYLPTHEECRLDPAGWQDGDYVHLHAVSGGGRFLFAVVSDADDANWALAVAQVVSYDGEAACPTSVTYLAETFAAEDIRIVTASLDTALVAVGADRTFWTVKMYDTGDGSLGALVCRTFDTKLQNNVTGVSLIDDVLFYKTQEGDASYIFYSDLDKDNDRAWDAVDRFPLVDSFVNDTDNDDIGDASDIIPGSSSCGATLETAPGECHNDYVVLYPCWAGFLVLSAGILGAYGMSRASERDRLYLKQRDTADEWVARQWRYSSGALGTSEDELKLEMAEVDREIQAYLESQELWMVQGVLFLLTILTVGIWVAMSWKSHSMKTQAILTWVDFFSATVFLLDLSYRWIFRAPGEYDGALHYVKVNWYDFPSLVTDVPGITSAGSLNVLSLARLVRMLRIFKMFRVIRLYYGVTRQQAVLSLILKHEHVWQALFCFALIASTGVVIKLVEDDYQDDFSNFWNVLWFCLVSVTTVGYGDMSPTNWAARILAMVLMLSGIGLIGVLTAKMGDRVRDSGFDQGLLQKQWMKMNEGKWLVSEEVLRSGTLFNPLLSTFKPYQSANCGALECIHPQRLQRDLQDSVSLTLIHNDSHTHYRFHNNCFACDECGRGRGSASEGVCWVIVKSKALQLRNQTGMRRSPSKVRGRLPSELDEKEKDEKEKDRDPYASEYMFRDRLYLHHTCLLEARGLIGPLEDLETESLNVEGLRGRNEALNGSYLRQATAPDESDAFSVVFNHKHNACYIRSVFKDVAEDDDDDENPNDHYWQLVNAEGEVVATAARLVGAWQLPGDEDKRLPVVVSDPAILTAWWNIAHDPLTDVPVRKLVMYYASCRTRAVFDDLLKTKGQDPWGGGGGGKFASARSRTMLVGMEQQMRRMGNQIRAVREMDARRAGLKVPCDHVDRLNVVMMSNIKDPSMVKDYKLLIAQLEYIIFRKPLSHPCSNTLAKAFALKEVLKISRGLKRPKDDVSDWGGFDDEDYDWSDMVETTLGEMDKALADHEVQLLENFVAIRTELEHLVLSYERVMMCRWAWDHLSWPDWQNASRRPERAKKVPVEMPPAPVDRMQYCAVEGIVLDPLSTSLEKHQLRSGMTKAAQLSKQAEAEHAFPSPLQQRPHRRASPFAGTPVRTVKPVSGPQYRRGGVTSQNSFSTR